MSITAKVDALATAVGGDVDALRDRVGDPSTLATTEQTVIVDAINEVKTIADAAAGGGVSINDAATNTTQAWSSNKISNEITSATASLVDSAPGTLDTLNELAAALGDDANFASTTTTALGNRLRFDAAQTLNGTEQTQALTNLGAASAADLTALETDVGDEAAFDPAGTYATARGAAI